MNKAISLFLSVALMLTLSFSLSVGAADKTLADFKVTGTDVTETDAGIQITSKGELFSTIPGVTAKSAVDLNNLEFEITGNTYTDAGGSVGMPGTAVPEIVVLLSPAGCDYGYGVTGGGLVMVIDFTWNNPNVGDFMVPYVTFYEPNGTNFWNGSVAGGGVAGTTATISAAKFGTAMKFKFVADEALGAKVYLNDTLLQKNDGTDIDLSFITTALSEGKIYFGMFPFCGQNHNLGADAKHTIKATLNSLNGEAVSSLQETFDGSFKLANFYQFNADGASSETEAGINLKMTAAGTLWSPHPTLVFKGKSDLDNLAADITLEKYEPECDPDFNETPEGFMPVVAIGLTQQAEPFAYGMPAGSGKNVVFFLRVRDDGSSYLEIFKADEGTNMASVANTNGVASGAGWGDKVTIRLKEDATNGYQLYLNGELQKKMAGEEEVDLDLNFIKEAFADGKAFFQITEFDNAGTAPLEITLNNLYTYLPNPTCVTVGAADITTSSATLNATFTDVDDESVTEYGIEYKETSATDWTKVALTAGKTSATVTGLKASTDYVFRAYITMNEETINGEEKEFTTVVADNKTPDNTSSESDNKPVADTGVTVPTIALFAILVAGALVGIVRKRIFVK